MTLLLHIVGARPNFMKAAAVLRGGSSRPHVRHALVHTGQHYDAEMSDTFFRDLGLPEPTAHLHVGSGSHAQQTARIMSGFEPVMLEHKPDWVVVYGDVNSTLGCALVAAKEHVPVAHVEAGVRSYDRRMPEEVNRVLTDQLADRCLVPHAAAAATLAREGIPAERIAVVGNVMVDAARHAREASRGRNAAAALGLVPGGYAVVTFHRASNVDDPVVLATIAAALGELASVLPVIFPVHPRTRARLESFGLVGALGGVRLVEPTGYFDTIDLVGDSAMVVTDSGGLQVETTALGVPCLTVRDVTEWTETVTHGTNRLVSPGALRGAAAELLEQRRAGRWSPVTPPGWDGAAGQRIVEALAG